MAELDDKIIDVDVLVVGAGISGLTAAYSIISRDPGIHVVVVEAKGGSFFILLLRIFC